MPETMGSQPPNSMSKLSVIGLSVCLSAGRMEESHFNSNPYFWPSIPTVSGQVSGGVFACFLFVLLFPIIYSQFCSCGTK